MSAGTASPARWERLLLAATLASTLGLSVRLWDQPRKAAALDERMEAVERALQRCDAPEYPGERPAVLPDLREQRVAASVVQALGPRLDQLASARSPSREPPTMGPERVELSAEQAAAAHEGEGLVEAAITAGQMESADTAQIREKLHALAGTPEGHALLARLLAAVNAGRLHVDLRQGTLPFLP